MSALKAVLRFVAVDRLVDRRSSVLSVNRMVEVGVAAGVLGHLRIVDVQHIGWRMCLSPLKAMTALRQPNFRYPGLLVMSARV
jgi:hypothetical protein